MKNYGDDNGKVKELFSVEAEEALVGSVLIEPANIELDVSPSDFWLEKLATIWAAARRLHNNDIMPDIVTLTDLLERDNKLDDVGGDAYLTALTSRCPNAYNARGYARTVQDYARRRAVVRAGSKLVADAHNLDGKFDEEVENTIEKLQDFTFPTYRESDWKSKVQRVNAGELQAAAIERGVVEPDYLPFLGESGYLVQGWSHIIAGKPKAGKTELITRLCMEWSDHKILYFTEENTATWELRLAGLPRRFQHCNLVFGLGMTPREILREIQRGDEDIVVIDTTRTFLRIEKESDNAEIARKMNPFVALCRQQSKSLFFAQHERKGGGNYGEGVAGGHAFVGTVDIFLEVLFDGNAHNRRKVQGNGRIVSIEELIYELRDDNLFYPLGSPSEVKISSVKDRLMAIGEDWKDCQGYWREMEEPRPSQEQIRKALNELAEEGFMESRKGESSGGRPPIEFRAMEDFTFPTKVSIGWKSKVSANDKSNGATEDLERRLADVYERWQETGDEELEREYHALNEEYKAMSDGGK